MKVVKEKKSDFLRQVKYLKKNIKILTNDSCIVVPPQTMQAQQNYNQIIYKPKSLLGRLTSDSSKLTF